MQKVLDQSTHRHSGRLRRLSHEWAAPASSLHLQLSSAALALAVLCSVRPAGESLRLAPARLLLLPLLPLLLLEVSSLGLLVRL